MLFLRERVSAAAAGTGAAESGGLLLTRCANLQCSTGWLRLWRSRRLPGFESRWACSAECMARLVTAAVQREGAGERGGARAHAHRVPLGLLLVEQGRLGEAQLRDALAAQERVRAETGERIRLGEWLVRSGVLTEEVLTRALCGQWNAPLFSLREYRPEEVATALPRFFAEALGAVPARVGAGRLLYLACNGGIDRSLSYALERMTGLRVASGLVADSEFRRAQAAYLATPAPRARYLEAASTAVLARAITRLVESEKPVEARLARVHEYYWLRLWRCVPEERGLPEPAAAEDLIATVGHPH